MKIKPFVLKQLQNLSQKLSFSPKIYFLIFGIASTAWFLMRVLPKPSRAGYPCVRAAAPVASAFVLYLLSLASSFVFFNRFAKYIKLGKLQLAALFLVLGLTASVVSLIHNNASVSASAVALETSNTPMGIAKGINPGRVVWVYNPDATNAACTNVYGDGYFMDTNTNQNEVDRMLEEALIKLTGQTTVAGAWDAIFKYHNQTRGKGSVTYASSESVFIKINATSTWYENINSSFERVNNGYYAISETSPQVILAVLRQLVNTVGIPESKIYVGDPLKHIYQDNYTKWHNEFPNVHYLDYNSTNLGREKVVKSPTAIVKYSDRGAVLKTTSGNVVYQDSLYSIFETMEYMINIPNLKAHEYGGVSMFGKNHFGSQTRSDASHLHSGLVRPSSSATLRNTYGQYRVQVDLMTHRLLGKKNLFYLMDALYCSDWSVTKPSKWQIAPFNNDWTSSIFLSQDPVAIESVGFDFLYAQYDGSDGKNNYPHLGGVDDYLHQLADSTQWPTGITYDPENDGTSIGYSQGVHEHWNNSTEKKYSRNLGSGYGIELVQDFMTAETIPVTGVTISPVNLTLVSGSNSALTAAISPSNATNRSVTWSSGNTSVVTVSSSGEVTALAAGTATITVTTADGGKTASCAVTVTLAASTNLALYKTTTSSSDENDGLTANYATDGDYGSRWSSAFSDPQWIYVDLGVPYNINRVKLFWEAAYGSSYKIQVSTDASIWTDVYSTTSGDGASDDLSIKASKGRYVRMYGTARGTEYGYSIHEFEVYGENLDTQPPTIPTGLNSPSQTLTTISLAWEASTDNVGVTGYDIYKNGTYAASTTSTSYTIDNLVAGTTYSFTIKAKDTAGNYSAASNTLTVSTLTIPVTGVTLSSSNLSLRVGSTSALTATILPLNATNQLLSWKSGNTSIASISNSGLVTAIAAGITTITVTTADGSKTATSTVTVTVPVTGVILSPTSLELTPGQTSVLSATIFPSNATDKSISWTSGNTNIATVEANGTVTAKATGTTTITVTTQDGNKTSTCHVNITIPVTEVSLSASSLTLTPGETSAVTATILPSNATDKTINWTSSNTDVATVDANGMVTAVGIGNTMVVATTLDGGITASCEVMVAIPVTGVILNTSSLLLLPGETFALTATISPSDATNQTISWLSGNSGAATVNTSGLITAVTLGTATIMVTTQDGNKKDSCKVIVTDIIPVTEVTLAPASLSMMLGETFTLAAAILPANATNQNITWSSNDNSVATVSNSGLVTAINEGSTTITATSADAGKTVSCPVTVSATIPVTGVAINTSFLSFATCQTATLIATVTPLDATNKNIIWTSDNTSVATVDANGVVKAIATGIAAITATTQDGSKTASCKISVTAQTLAGVADGVSGTITCKKTSVTLATLSGTSFTNYMWTGPNSFSSTAKSPSVSTPGIYILTANDTTNKCTVTAITNVLQNTLKPNARASSNGTLSCGTKTVSLKVTTSSSNAVITWDGQSTGVNPVTMQWPGKYFVTIKDTVNGCTKRDSVTVSQYITYNPTQFSNNTFSAYTNGTIADNNTNGWTLDRSKISGVTSTYVLNTTPKFFAIYSKRITAQKLGAEGIWMSKVMTVSGKPNFQIGVKISTEGTFTSSDYVKLYYKLDGGSEILWGSRTGSLGTVDFRSPILNANTVQIVVKLYTTLKGTSVVSNQYIEQYQLYIQDCGYPLVVYSSASGAINCANPSVTLQANSSHAGATYKWSGPNSYTSASQYPVVSVPGTYTVTASMPTTASSSVTSSTATGTVTITQNVTTPGVSVGVPDSISSQKKFVTLSGSSPTSSVYFSWAGPNSFVSSQQNPVVTATGAYMLTVINPVNGCSSTAAVNVVQNATKSVILQPIAVNPADQIITRDQPTLELYPNPARNLLFLKASGINKIVSLKVMDIRGNIKNIPLEGNGFYLNVSGLNSGMYILVVETDKCIFTKKFIRE